MRLIPILFFFLLIYHESSGQIGQPGQAPGQVPLDPGYRQPFEPIKNVLAGSYASNVTLFFRNSPYRVLSDVTVEHGVTLTIETGVRIYFDTGAGLIVKGVIRAIGNEFAHIEMLPYQQQINYDGEMPRFRLVDGPTVRQGRLQVQFRERWRSVCTMLTNWTSIDTGVACRSMGYSDGGFWRWFRRNNETYPFAMPRPDCQPTQNNLWDCRGFADVDQIRLSENLCQGEDDIGIYCWGRPTFTGWARHWKGLHIYNSPFQHVASDPDDVSMHRESHSRLEFLDILYAGYDGITKNTTSALLISGVPPILNGLRVERSARDGIRLEDVNGPLLLANSTVSFNRGHGIMVDNTTDARIFINNSLIQSNWGDGIWYKQMRGVRLIEHGIRAKRAIALEEKPRINLCETHEIDRNLYFPHLISIFAQNRSTNAQDCWMTVSLPVRFQYTYSFQFLSVINKNPTTANSFLNICETPDFCDYRVPLKNDVYPQTVAIKNTGNSVRIQLDHDQEILEGDINVLFRIHATVKDKAYYGLNVTNCIIQNNTGNGIFASEIRERTAVTNVTLDGNQGYAGFHVRDGAADIWLNETRILRNWGDGMNISYAGGSIMVNGTIINANRWRGIAVHYNTSIPFLALHNEFIIKGRPSNNPFYLPSIVSNNYWGGIVIGNTTSELKVLVNWVEFQRNRYHPALEIHSNQRSGSIPTLVDVTGNRFEQNHGFGMRIAPAVNMILIVNSNHFLRNNNTALFVKNAHWPWLSHLPANVTISKNTFKYNRAKYIISIGLNEGSDKQWLLFNQQNEVRSNIVINPYPLLSPRSSPYAALVVSSSNVRIHRNCFKNEQAQFEIGSELEEHSKWIDARENNWGSPIAQNFIDKMFDQFNRYSLATIDINPYMAVCNQRAPHVTPLNEVFRQFRKNASTNVLGGIIYENYDLPRGVYHVLDDLHVVPGAKLTIAAGSELRFANGVGMLVQGELTRNEFDSLHGQPVLFTHLLAEHPPLGHNIRLVDESGQEGVAAGRLEVLVDEQWGTVCNRSWTAELTRMACAQLGMAADLQFFENWRLFRDAGDLPMVMDNLRCEEHETDVTKCRHDGVERNCAAGCKRTEVVAIRCLKPQWSGVRYSLLANAPTVTGQSTMSNWIIEKAGLFDYRTSTFSAALSIDWNYHSFHNIVIRQNLWDGLDVSYNDLIKKPTLRNCQIVENRRNGVHVRSAGITIENVTISNNGQSGIRYDPSIGHRHQSDIVSWLSLREQPELDANNIIHIPNRRYQSIEIYESHLNQRKFLVASDDDLPEDGIANYFVKIRAVGFEYGLSSKLAVQIVNPVSNRSDEDAVILEPIVGKSWSARRDQIAFPIVSTRNELHLRYTKTYGKPRLVLLILFLDTQEYLDRFVHVYNSRIHRNQYGFSSEHYSNFTFNDGRFINRRDREKLWLQKVNFTENSEAVMWLHSHQHEVPASTPLATITYHLDNCSISGNNGPIVESHRDLFASANVFHWLVWSNTFENNTNSGFSLNLPDSHQLYVNSSRHRVEITENRFRHNRHFQMSIHGYYSFVNISSNNFTDNWSHQSRKLQAGIIEITGMEKEMVVERNRMSANWGNWMLRVATDSHHLGDIAASVRYNYFEGNRFVEKSQDYVDMWPRSFCLGVFGVQRVDVHFNRFKNTLMDFELISGTKYTNVNEKMNVTHNWWGTGNVAEIRQRIFDFDDWNIYTLANWSPFYVQNALFIHFWFDPFRDGQLASEDEHQEPSVFDLHGRMNKSKTLTLISEQWHSFPHYYRPYRPYRITKDLTILPGATLTIEEGVDVHVWPNVRILVLGNLIANGSYWRPIRFRPINRTEYAEISGLIPSEFRVRRSSFQKDTVFESFPSLHRFDPFYQKIELKLNASRSDGSFGFIDIYNATSGEWIPSCDRLFTVRNAQVVCRQLGLSADGAQHWLTPRWDYNPLVNIRKTYAEPRECKGDELRLDECDLRLSSEPLQWQCHDNEHFNFVRCQGTRVLHQDYIGNWGGISFGKPGVEFDDERDLSRLQYVEIVGAGHSHNETIQTAGLQIFHRSPFFDNLNITNSSMDGVQIISSNIRLTGLNITDNAGKGIRILSINGANDDQVINQPIQLPYHANGFMDICASIKTHFLQRRVLLFYKYDSRPVDCLKTFKASGRRIAFRLIQQFLYKPPFREIGRYDSLRVFSSPRLSPNSLLAEFTANRTHEMSASSSDSLTVHLRAQAADGAYGFIAEVLIMSTSTGSSYEKSPFRLNLEAGGARSKQESLDLPIDSSSRQIVLKHSRIDNNLRGALSYMNIGDISSPVIISSSSFSENGRHLYANITTSMTTLSLNVHNTMKLILRANTIARNQCHGDIVRIIATSSSPVVRLNGFLSSNLLAYNRNGTVLRIDGNNYQHLTMIDNVVSENVAVYHDTIVSRNVVLNMTRNVVFKNVGLHQIHSKGVNVFVNNHFYENVALGHEHQYLERFGYQKEFVDEFVVKRPRRQVIEQVGVSFDWWTHVDNETARYRSTILAENAQQVYHYNTFNDPQNDYELTTSAQSRYETSLIDARYNYWGYPGTIGVASGKIRDQEDYNYLNRVNYQPVLESNTSLIEGDCPAGWFQAGRNEFKACFLQVAAATTFSRAVEYCEHLDAFVPYLRANDERQQQLASRMREKLADEPRVWISSVNVPLIQCATLNVLSAKIEIVNCNSLRGFVCEKGTQPYVEPIMWRPGIVAAVVIGAVLLALILLLVICWWIKSTRRRHELAERKSVLRASIQLQKKAREHEKRQAAVRSHESAHASLHTETPSWRRYPKSPPPPTTMSTSYRSDDYTEMKPESETYYSSSYYESESDGASCSTCSTANYDTPYRKRKMFVETTM